MTILLRSTPLAAIWNTAEFGHSEVDAVKRPLQVVYSVVPSVRVVSKMNSKSQRDITYGCRTKDNGF